MPKSAAVTSEQWRRALVGCAFATRGLRAGYLPFSAPCVARRLAGDADVCVEAAMQHVRRLVEEHGGGVVEEEVVWLPADEFEQLWSTR